jgi:hypothetical protein
MPLVPGVMQLQINNILSQSGRSLQHQRHTGAVYDAAKTYQNPTADVITINESITVAWVPAGSKLIVQYFGVVSPDDIGVLTASTIDLKGEDLLVVDYTLATEKVYKVLNVTQIEYQGTKLGTVAVIKLIPGRRVSP